MPSTWDDAKVAPNSGLIDDSLRSAKFLESYEPLHERVAVADYERNFLEPIVISDKALGLSSDPTSSC
ncbi:MAG: hypothetical protein ABSF89_10430 [Acidimicrobiales bacterium]|jgi:hypothetical protein